MGKRNSSLTRVAPIFDALYNADPSGAAWLPGLFRLGNRSAKVAAIPCCARLVSGHRPTWGKAELALPAPASLLEYLVRNITMEDVARSGDRKSVREKRAALARQDSATIAAALSALRNGRRESGWYVLEGASKPDAILELEDSILVVEGKRTEHSCTSVTKWMRTRSQLLRHMDAATEHFAAKRVSAFYSLREMAVRKPKRLRSIG